MQLTSAAELPPVKRTLVRECSGGTAGGVNHTIADPDVVAAGGEAVVGATGEDSESVTRPTDTRGDEVLSRSQSERARSNLEGEVGSRLGRELGSPVLESVLPLAALSNLL